MKILAIDLGKFQSTACVYLTHDQSHRFETLDTTPQDLHDAIAKHQPDRLVIEVGPSAGWIHDLARTMGVEHVQVANVNHRAWQWCASPRKTDRDDALKLATLSMMNQLPTVAMPEASVRQWRHLINHRQSVVTRQTQLKNQIRAVLCEQGLSMPSGKKGWTKKSLAGLELLAKPLAQCAIEELWRGTLMSLLTMYRQVRATLEPIEKKLEQIARSHEQVQRLQTIPGVGQCLAQTVVAIIDDPHRFKSGKQVGCYAGLTPRLYESSTIRRDGGISGQGNKLLRSLLVEVSWLMRRGNTWARECFDRLARGDRKRRKKAIVALARKLLVICWAMMRDRSVWDEPLAMEGRLTA